MSAVNNNAFTSGFPAISAAGSEFGPVGEGSVLPRSSGSRDSIGPIAQPVFPMPGDGAGGSSSVWSGGWNSGSDSGLSGFNAIMNGFVNALQNVLASIGRQFGVTPASGQSASPAQTYFASATASSVGDPHDTFDGTPGSGANVERKWDSMNSHADLLDSDSIAGGYRVSTTVTSPNDEGVSTNARAQVALDGGAAKITMDQDGSYSVFENGRDTSLERGRAQPLGNGESVTLNADSSLSVNATNGSGGTLATKFTARGGGVDVENSATNVDLGGYLVTHLDEAANAAVSQAPISYAYDAAPGLASADRQIVVA